jgi:uncharacterized membrane protein YphA (DoxX/SURF4 family)
MKNPLSASLFAAVVTALAIYFTNKDKNVKNSAYTKPAFFVGLLVYFIVYSGNARYETISKDPF